MQENLKNLEILKTKAKTYLLEKSYELAIKQYNECLEMIQEKENLDFPKREKAIIYLNIGLCYLSLKQEINAENFIDKSIEIDPSYIKAYYRKILSLKSRENYLEALEICQKVLNFERNPEILALAVCFFV